MRTNQLKINNLWKNLYDCIFVLSLRKFEKLYVNKLNERWLEKITFIMWIFNLDFFLPKIQDLECLFAFVLSRYNLSILILFKFKAFCSQTGNLLSTLLRLNVFTKYKYTFVPTLSYTF